MSISIWRMSDGACDVAIAIAGQAIDPLAQLMETAYIGRLGSVELASADITRMRPKFTCQRRPTALMTSPMRVPAKQFLALRALGAPAFVVSLALQGIFRGFKDTKTPVFCLASFDPWLFK
ncbi:hypothetical protein HAX54_051894 [Datura stramonium]|uniref:Uncharacterized protein n=1 Tax=Datura stramonium TaxID=4076 RepID=A0ABS8SYZ5_DATST|nr:hypothetical protein [Datura stramonium]